MTPSPACPRARYPETQTCSGRAVQCADGLECECENQSLWTGRGDFLFRSPTCALSVPAVRALYGALALVSLAALAVTLLYLRDLEIASRRTRLEKSALGMTAAACGCLGSLGYAVLGAYRAAWPLATVGTDVLATVLFVLAGVAFTGLTIGYDCSLFVLGFAQAGIAQERIDERLVRRVQGYMWAHLVLVVFCAACTLCLLVQTETAFRVAVPMYCAGYAALMAFMSLVFLRVFPLATRKIRDKAGLRATHGALKDILAQIDSITSSGNGAGVFAVAVSVIFGAWEGARNVAFPYVIVVIYIMAQFWQIQCMITLRKVTSLAEQHSNSSDPRRTSSSSRPIMGGGGGGGGSGSGAAILPCREGEDITSNMNASTLPLSLLERDSMVPSSYCVHRSVQRIVSEVEGTGMSDASIESPCACHDENIGTRLAVM